MKRVLAFTLLLLSLIVGNVNAKVDTFYVSSGDVYMRSLDADYETAHDMAKPNNYYNTTLVVSRIGQINGEYVQRTFWNVITADLHDGADISIVTVHFNVDEDWSITDFDLTIYQGLWSSAPPESAAFEFGVGWDTTTSGGSLNTSGLGTGWKTITLNADGRDMINLTGTTRFALVSSRDISRDAPSGDEYIEINSANHGSYPPFVVVTYTFPGDDAPDSVLTNSEINPTMAPDTLPYFRCRYQDTGTSDSVWWQVGTSASDSNMWNSGWIDIAPVAAGSMIDSVLYAGTALSRAPTVYYIRVKTMAVGEAVSAWSDVNTFRIVGAGRVYGLIMFDAECGNAPFNEDSLHAGISFDTWYSPSGFCYEVMQKDERLNYPDYVGNLIDFNWGLISGEFYDSASGSWGDHYEAGRSVYDTCDNVWTSIWSDSGYSDIKTNHDHWVNWNGVDKWVYGGAIIGQDDDDYDTLFIKRRMADKLFQSDDTTVLLATRGGWNREHAPLHTFLKSWVLFDPTNVAIWVPSHPSWEDAPTGDVAFRPYNPSDTNWQIDDDPHQTRFIFGIVEIEYMTSPMYTNAWNLAASEGSAILAVYDHGHEDIASHLGAFYDSMQNHVEDTGIPIIFGNIVQVMRWSRGWTDSLAPTFTITQLPDDSIEVALSEKIFNPCPFGVMLNPGAEDSVKYEFIVFNEIDDSTWRYSKAVYPYKAKFAVIDTCGNSSLASVTPSEYKVVSIYSNGVVESIFKPDSLMKIYGENPK